MNLKDHLPDQLLQTFQSIIQSDRLSHAYLFSGNYGSFEMALYIAQSQFCEDPQDKLPCGECRACRLVAAGEFSDLKIIEPSGQLIKTDTVRGMLREFSSSGFENQAQFFIIREADKMHPNAANSLLKYIEEPSSHSYMVLLTQEEDKVLPTIKSRTQVFSFPKDFAALSRFLEKKGLLKSQAQLIATLARDYQEAEALASQNKVLELMKDCQHFVSVLSRQENMAYLEVSRLVARCQEKSEQAYVFDILTALLAQSPDRGRAALVSKLYRARQMWLSHVSFQNALEYMVIG
ncbi:DNA polymerase III subunit delta' [Streptococcus ferus]|uniref:DNA polymerase III subunit delta' n=1 Tax=Streptococcus ferus TaxID=1345 RepID=UPI00359F15CF